MKYCVKNHRPRLFQPLAKRICQTTYKYICTLVYDSHISFQFSLVLCVYLLVCQHQNVHDGLHSINFYVIIDFVRRKLFKNEM